MDHEAGGFFLTPPPSSTASSTTHASSRLPHPRSSPLRTGGNKESTFIRYVDAQILHMQRRFAKRTTPSGNGLSDVSRDEADVWGDVKGYTSMKEACQEISDLVGLIWKSGTPSLQVPYLINLASFVVNVISAMPPTPRSLFALIGKMDHAFTSLLQGRNVETGETLPGFEGRKGVSGTEKVRIRSVVERTRVKAVEAFQKGDFADEVVVAEHTTEDSMDLDGELILEGIDLEPGEDDDDSRDLQLARVYDSTIVELGYSLEEPNIGVITEIR